MCVCMCVCMNGKITIACLCWNGLKQTRAFSVIEA